MNRGLLDRLKQLKDNGDKPLPAAEKSVLSRSKSGRVQLSNRKSTGAAADGGWESDSDAGGGADDLPSGLTGSVGPKSP